MIVCPIINIWFNNLQYLIFYKSVYSINNSTIIGRLIVSIDDIYHNFTEHCGKKANLNSLRLKEYTDFTIFYICQFILNADRIPQTKSQCGHYSKRLDIRCTIVRCKVVVGGSR